MIDFDRPIKDDIKPYENIRKTAIGLGDIIQLVAYLIIFIWKKITRWLQ